MACTLMGKKPKDQVEEPMKRLSGTIPTLKLEMNGLTWMVLKSDCLHWQAKWLTTYAFNHNIVLNKMTKACFESAHWSLPTHTC